MGDNAPKFLVAHPMSSTASTPAPLEDAADGKIPRPPNSWILYRADMSQALAAQNPGSSRSQADISKIISQMWKTIDPNIKAEYERRAEMKKLEHAMMYPQYRYNPKSKAEKDREREEKKQLKAEGRLGPKRSKRRTSAASSAQNTPALGTLPFPLTAAYPAVIPSQYGLAGPSPPLSAANSPSPVTTWLEPQHSQDIHAPVDATASTPCAIDPSLMAPATAQPLPTRPYYRTQPEASQEQLLSHHFLQGPPLVQPQPEATSHYRSLSRRLRPEDPSYLVARKQHQQQKQQSYQIPQSEQDLHQDQYQQAHPTQQVGAFSLEDANTYLLPDGASRTAVATDNTFSFHLPNMAVNNMEAWTFENPEFTTSYNNALSNADGNNCFQVQFDPFQDLAGAGRSFEVELGELLPWASILNQDAFDWSALPHGWELSAPTQPNLVAPADTEPISSLLSMTMSAIENATATGPSSQPSADLAAPASQPYRTTSTGDRTCSEDFDKFIDFDSTYDYPASVAQSQTMEMPPPNAYKPPSGAVLSSVRRVAASWDHSFAIADA